MADDERTPAVASAVMIPEPEDYEPLSNKRRRSDASSSSMSKRAKLHEHSSDLTPPSNASRPSAEQERLPSRRKDFREEDRKRGQRLFGGLLSALSNTGGGARRKKPAADAEKRQQIRDEALQQSEESRKKDYDALMARRRQEHKVLQEQARRLKHQNLRAMAKYLRTAEEPAIYYLPYQLSPKQQRVIDEQIQKAEALIAKELSQVDTSEQPATKPENADLDTNASAEDNGVPDAEAKAQDEVSAPAVGQTDQPVEGEGEGGEAEPPPASEGPRATNEGDPTLPHQQHDENDSDKDDAEGAEVNGEDTLLY